MRILLYTAVFGNYDKVRPLKPREADVDAVVFCDRETNVPDGWEKVLVNKDQEPNATRLNRAIKMTPERFIYTGDYDVLIYVDGSMSPKTKLIHDARTWFSSNGLYEAVLFKHPERERVDQEMEACIKLGKIEKDIARRLEPIVFRQNAPLWAGGFFARTQENGLGREWWKWCVKLDCWRDQLVLPRAVFFWAREKKLLTIRRNVWQSPYWVFRRHGS